MNNLRKIVRIHSTLVKEIKDMGLKFSLTLNKALIEYLNNHFNTDFKEEDIIENGYIVEVSYDSNSLLPKDR